MKLFDQTTYFYMPVFFKIKLATSLKFEEIIGSKEEPLFFHEYLHFLQDVLTTYGLANMSKVFNCIKYLYHNVKAMQKEGDYVLTRPVDFSGATDINDDLFSFYLGYTDTEILLENTEVCDISISESVPYEGKQYSVKEYNVKLSNGRYYCLGAHAIMECLCHTLQKKIYKSKYQLQVPYDLPLLVWNYYFKDKFEIKSNIPMFLDLLEFSLQFYNPAEIFFSTIDILLGKSSVKFDQIDDCFYKQLLQTWHSSDNENAIELYFTAYNAAINDIKGTLVSDIYVPYKNWILTVLSNSKNYKVGNNSIFSTVYSMSEDEVRSFLIEIINIIGLPPIYNNDGVLFIKGIIEEKRRVLSLFGYISFFSSQALLSVYNYLRGYSAGCDEDLIKACKYVNMVTKSNVWKVDENCEHSPYEKFNPQIMCPFTAVWNTFGLAPMQIFG